MAAVLPPLGILAGAALGAMGLLSPHAAFAFVGVRAAAPEGLAEGRATYGGLFLFLELEAARQLLRGNASGARVAGLAWVGAAVGRAVSLALDGAERRTKKNFGAVGFELVIGLAHLAALLGEKGKEKEG
ncbi:putative membrane protein [Hyaloraphidium curvatum]|nr:putative membrane protein [Hyaloraphidium curvatum]